MTMAANPMAIGSLLNQEQSLFPLSQRLPPMRLGPASEQPPSRHWTGSPDSTSARGGASLEYNNLHKRPLSDSYYSPVVTSSPSTSPTQPPPGWSNLNYSTSSSNTNSPPSPPSSYHHRSSSAAQRERREFRPIYAVEEEYFIWYHRVDLRMTWQQVKNLYNRQFHHRQRSGFQGIQCKYYRCTERHGVPRVRDRTRVAENPKSFGVRACCPDVWYPWMREPRPYR